MAESGFCPVSVTVRGTVVGCTLSATVEVMSATLSAPSRPHRGRAWFSGILIVLAIVTTPLAIVANWASNQVTNTELFVDTLGPLASDPVIQEAIVDQVTNSIDDAVQIEKVTGSIIDGFADALSLPDSVKEALGVVSQPIAAGVKAVIHQVVGDFVKSPAFQEAWTKVLTITQEEVIALLANDPKSIFTLADDGTLSMPLKPIIGEIKASLIEQGVTIASAIPEIDTMVELGKFPELATARVAYQVGTALGTWLPWAALIAFVVGILVANNRPRALVASGIGLGAVMALMFVLFDSGFMFLTSMVQPTVSPAAGVVYNAVVLYARDVVGTVLVASIILILIGWMLSPSTARIRTWLNARLEAGRAGLDDVGLKMGKTGQVLGSQVTPIRWVIVMLGVIAIVFSSTHTVGLIITWTLVTLLALTVFELAWRKPAPKKSAAPKPAAQKPAPQKPAAQKTVAKKPAAKKAASGKPAAKK